MTWPRRVLTSILVLLTPQTVLAASWDKGFPGTQTVVELISKLFNFEFLTRNPAMMDAFFKFLFFMALFAIINLGARKVFANKDNNPHGARTASIVSFVVALITVISIPTKSIVTVSTFWAAAVMLVLVLLLPGLLIWWAFKKKEQTP